MGPLRVLIIDVASSADVIKTKAALVADGHHVEVVDAADTKKVRASIEGGWDLIVTEWLTSPTTIDLLEQARAMGIDAPACIVCTVKVTPANMQAAFAAGAEDFLRKPVVAELLRGRVGRIKAQRERLAAARAGTEPGSSTAKVTGLAAWSGFEGLAAGAVAGVTMVDVAITREPKLAEPWLASSMLLSIPSVQVECRAIVDGDRESLELLAEAAVGDRGQAAIVDLLNEIVNNAAGAFMRSAHGEEVVVTSGLPAPINRREVDTLLDCSKNVVGCWLVDPVSGAQLRLRLGIRVRKNAFVEVISLREGMVLVRDLRGPEGGILLTAGTRVTSSTSERLRRLLDARCVVEVAETAA